MSTEENRGQATPAPGQYPPEAYPKPTRIECIRVDKVYDSCFEVVDKPCSATITTGGSGDFKTGAFHDGDLIPCSLQPGQGISCSVIKKTPAGNGFFNILLLVKVPLTLYNPYNRQETVNRTCTFTRAITLCCPDGVSTDCSESALNICSCVVSDVEKHQIAVECSLQVCLVVKCLLSVQLLVPSFGFCAPVPCVSIPGHCPPLPPAQCR